MGRVLLVAAADHGYLQPVIAVNLALAFSRGEGEVVLFDASTGAAGELELVANAAPARSVAELCALASRNPSLLKGYVPHGAFPSIVAGMPENPEFAPEELAAAVRALAGAGGTVVVNAPRTVDDCFAALSDAADAVCLVSLDDLLNVNRVKALREELTRRHIPDASLCLLLCEQESRARIPAADIAALIRLPVYASLPLDNALIAYSLNTGKPALAAEPGSPFARSVCRLAETLAAEQPRQAHTRDGAGPHDAQEQDGEERYQRLKQTVRCELLETLKGGAARFDGMADRERAAETRLLAENCLRELAARHGGWLSREERAKFVAEMLDDVAGLGCLEGLLRDPGVTEIMVNGPERIYVERKGRIEPTALRFESAEQLMTVIERIVAPVGRRIDESSPLVDARLADGSRVNAVIPPVSLAGPSLTIRKFFSKKLTMDDLVGFGSLTPGMAAFIRACVLLRRNIIISGGTGSGKTTLLNVVASFIPAAERIVTIEDSAELRLPQDHVVRLESRPASIEGTGEIPIRRLMVNALRMRPDRVIVGECRGGEALDMLQAMNTGHDGSLSTLHANSPRDAISRLSTMVIMAGTELPERAVREQIGAAVHLIIQVSRLSDGTRKITEIAEARGAAGDSIVIAPIFRFAQRGVAADRVEGEFQATGELPSFMDEAAVRGLAIDRALFLGGGAA